MTDDASVNCGIYCLNSECIGYHGLVGVIVSVCILYY